MLNSCSKSTKTTQARLSLKLGSVIDLNAALVGGAFVWGKSSSGDSFGSVMEASSANEIDLTNGSWTFWAVSWEGDGSGDKMTGVARCGKTTFNLIGGNANVNLSLSNLNCGTMPDFSPSMSYVGGVYKFPKIVHNECFDLSDHVGVGCKKNPNGKAKTVSKRFILPSFKKSGSAPIQFLPGHLASKCRQVTEATNEENIPPGNGLIPLITSLNSFYSSSSCDPADPKGVRVTQYDFGLANTARFDSKQFVTTGTCGGSLTSTPKELCLNLGGFHAGTCSLTGDNLLNINPSTCLSLSPTPAYTDVPTDRRIQIMTMIPAAEVCSGPRADYNHTTPHVFSSGNGTVDSPYTICREAQLNKIMDDFPSAHFSLLAHLDMNRTSVIGDQPRPTCFTDPGANFSPIGGLFDGGCTEFATSSVTYGGVFNGNGYSISNIRLRSDADEIGFIRKGGIVHNLTFYDSEIEGKTKVGNVFGTDPLEMSNIKIYGADLRGQHMVGGVVGAILVPGGPTQRIRQTEVHDTFIEQDQGSATYSVGGVLGMTDQNFEIVKSSFNGMIYSKTPGARLGGIIGHSESNATIRESLSTGSINAIGSSYVGGLFGYINANAFIHNSYSRMSLGISRYDNTATSGYFGGLIAFSSALTAENSYYYGSIIHNCTDAGVACTVGSISASAAPTPAFSSSTDSRAIFISTSINNSEPNTAHKLGSRTTFESGVDSPNFLFPSRESLIWADVGAPYPLLKWETGECSEPVNNLGLSVQSSSPHNRGGSAANPLVICHYNQWLELPTYSFLFSRLGANLALGDIPNAYMIGVLSNQIDGNGFIISGFHATPSTPGGGLFHTINGTGVFKNATISAGRIYGTGGDVGLAKINSGVMTDLNAAGMMILGTATNAGIIAGINNNTANNIVVDGLNKSTGNVGLVFGTNNAGAEAKAVKVTGAVIQTTSSPSGAGGAVGVNLGFLKEFEIRSEVINASAAGNSNSAARIGAFVGINSGTVDDSLVTEDARMTIQRTGPKYGTVFGQTTSTSLVRRLLAVNEVGADATYSIPVADFNHVTGDNHASATYEKTVTLTGGAFDYQTAPVHTITAVSITGDTIDYTTSSAYSLDGSFPHGYYSPSYFGRKSVSRRLYFIGGIGTHTATTITTDLGNLSHFSIPDTTGLNSQPIHRVSLRTNLTVTGITHMAPIALQTLTNYCSSFSGPSAAEESCNETGGFNIVRSTIGTTGANRLFRSYNAIFAGDPLPADRPIWVLDDGEFYPTLFSAD